MYEKGLIRVHGPCEHDADGICTLFLTGAHSCWVTDSRSDRDDLEFGEVYLPHSCNEWVIGGPEQIAALIEDLTEVLNRTDTRFGGDAG